MPAYCEGMTKLLEITVGNMVLLHAPPKEAMLQITARMALAGPVCVLDGGNQFNAYQVARLVRRQTAELDLILNRIEVARAFTCYQVVKLFEECPRMAKPYVVFDLLSTFYDESVSDKESYRLLHLVLNRLKHLRLAALLVISLYPPPQEARRKLVQMVQALADHVFTWEGATTISHTQPTTQLKLF